jgi:2-keto-3-deoxy-L-rhamnonate aldolase RhmA
MGKRRELSRRGFLEACGAGAVTGPLAESQATADTPAGVAGKWENPVRQQLAQGQPVIGMTVTVGSVEVAAQAANLGFDFLWVELEHSPISWETLRSMVLATRGLKAMPFVRVPVNELWTAKRALDAGALGVIFPFTSTPELARQAVAACKYPPTGKRGSGPGLASFRWPAPDEGYHAFANRNVMVIAIIEDQPGVDQVEEIASVPGVDAIFIGPSDLSWQLAGGDGSHPKVREAMDRIIAAAKRHGKVLGRPAGSPEDTKKFMAQGFRFFQGPSELGLLRNGARPLLDPLGKRGIDPKTRSLY